MKNCAFIMHTAEDKFVCHTFACEPSSGALCKTIEAACKVSIEPFYLLYVGKSDTCFIFANIFEQTSLNTLLIFIKIKNM